MPNVATADADLAQNTIIVPSATYYLSLHTANPGTTGTSEASIGRQTIQFGASSGGTQASITAQNWASAAGGQTYGFFGIWTAITGGTFVRGGLLASNITPTTGSPISVAVGAITLTAS
jgi:hypothetical protein